MEDSSKALSNKRDINSEIDWKIIDQLDNAVLNFSRNSMQAKKILFTMLGVFLAALMQVTPEAIGTCLKCFPFVIAIVVLFWAFDAYTYYYQEKLRAAMDARFYSLTRRYPSDNMNDEFTLPDNRTSCGRVLRAFFNISSALFYITTILLISVAWWMIKNGCFI